MRFRLAFALTALPLALVSYLSACSPDKDIENLCGWLTDENNCYRTFAADIGEQCGALFTAPPASPDQSVRVGYFLKRAKLDLCVLDGLQGGQILFDPPLDVTTFPVTTASFAFITGEGKLCGAGAVGDDGAMAISVEPSPALADGGTDGGSSACVSQNGAQICGGTFSVTPVTERELVDTKCPSGEAHHFNRLQLSKCPEVEQLFPRAEIESSAGGVGIDGYVTFRVVYPPTTGALANATPTTVEYFTCMIPSAPETCANGIQDDGEPTVDCGAICSKGCADGDLCFVDLDCASKNCTAVGGIKQCVANANCSNGVLDTDETDVDCGVICGSNCTDCKTCTVGADCASGICLADATGAKTCRASVDATCESSDAGAGDAGDGG